MIHCYFCPERATFVYVPKGVLAHGPEAIAFCQAHLMRYYLGLHYAGWRV